MNKVMLVAVRTLLGWSFLAAMRIASDGLVAAQFTASTCQVEYLGQCFCDCATRLVSQYCLDASHLDQCECTDAEYHAQLSACLVSTSCANLDGLYEIASVICQGSGYSFANLQPSATGAIHANTAAATAQTTAAPLTAALAPPMSTIDATNPPGPTDTSTSSDSGTNITILVCVLSGAFAIAASLVIYCNNTRMQKKAQLHDYQLFGWKQRFRRAADPPVS